MSEAQGKIHSVQQGESTTRLAFEHGLFPETLWKHPNNEMLRKKREHPNILTPEDEIFIPNREEKTVEGSTEEKHRFRRKGVPEKLNIRFLDENGEPYANEPYVLTIDGTNRKGNLDETGWLRVLIPPNAKSGEIEVGIDGCLEQCELNFGRMDPKEKLTGIQSRLMNLGYYYGNVDGKMNELLEQAIAKFRLDNQLPGEKIDHELQEKLKELFGS